MLKTTVISSLLYRRASQNPPFYCVKENLILQSKSERLTTRRFQTGYAGPKFSGSLHNSTRESSMFRAAAFAFF